MFKICCNKILKIICIPVFIACCILLFSCGNNANESQKSVEVTDMGNNKVTVMSPATKVIDLWPEHTNSFFVMNAGNLLCGIASNDSINLNAWGEFFYSGAKNIKCFNNIEPSIEEITALSPDCVILNPTQAGTNYEKELRAAGLKILNLCYSNYAEMQKSYKVLAKVLGSNYEEKLNNWADKLKNNIEERQVFYNNVNTSKLTTPLVHYIPGKSDSILATTSANSIVKEWIELAHSEYLSARLNLNEDTSLKPKNLNDADYFFVGGPYKSKIMEEINNSEVWHTYKAVQNGHVVGVPVGVYSWSGLGLESLLMLDYAIWQLQPDFATGLSINNESMIQKTIDFYKDMSGKELNKKQAEYILNGKDPNGKDFETKALSNS